MYYTQHLKYDGYIKGSPQSPLSQIKVVLEIDSLFQSNADFIILEDIDVLEILCIKYPDKTIIYDHSTEDACKVGINLNT